MFGGLGNVGDKGGRERKESEDGLTGELVKLHTVFFNYCDCVDSRSGPSWMLYHWWAVYL